MSKSSKPGAPKQSARPVALLVRAGGGKRRMIDDPGGVREGNFTALAQYAADLERYISDAREALSGRTRA